MNFPSTFTLKYLKEMKWISQATQMQILRIVQVRIVLKLRH